MKRFIVVIVFFATLLPLVSYAQHKELPEDWDKTHFLTGGVGASITPQVSFGVTYGQVQILGWYVSAFTGTGYQFNGDFDANSGNMVTGEYPVAEDYYTGRVSKTRFSLTGGLVFRTIKPLWIYLGTGYGYRSITFGTQAGYWVRSQFYTYSGMALDAGMIVNFKRVAISLGVSTIGFHYLDTRLGVGFTF